MKGRTKFFNYFIACIATLSLATFAACSDDDPETPSGKLVLTASASSFVAGEGNVTFMVTYDGEDWNAENCAFVVYVFKEEANGKYIVNNGAECTVDGSVDYRYNLYKKILC